MVAHSAARKELRSPDKIKCVTLGFSTQKTGVKQDEPPSIYSDGYPTGYKSSFSPLIAGFMAIPILARRVYM